MQDLHGIMEVTKETTDVDLMTSLIAEILGNVVVEGEKKKRKNRRDDELKRGKKISRDKMSRVACVDEGCGKTSKLKGNMKFHIEGKHIEGVRHPCNLCEKIFRSRHLTEPNMFV